MLVSQSAQFMWMFGLSRHTTVPLAAAQILLHSVFLYVQQPCAADGPNISFLWQEKVNEFRSPQAFTVLFAGWYVLMSALCRSDGELGSGNVPWDDPTDRCCPVVRSCQTDSGSGCRPWTCSSVVWQLCHYGMTFFLVCWTVYTVMDCFY